MAMTCQQLWREVSDYVDGAVSSATREEVERHLAYCRYCSAVVDGVRNVVVLVADGRIFELPIGFTQRLKTRLQKELQKEL
jgi:anti-sigma factor RsiW